MKVLLVDDDPVALELLAVQLATLGCETVASFERAEDALRELGESMASIDLVFCDLQMPDMDGVELVRHMARINFPGGVVLLSGEDKRILQTVERLASAHKLRTLAALSKPASMDELRAVIERARDHAPLVRRAARKSYGPVELERAIAAGELVNHYQPQVDMISGTLIGLESLVRWEHPEDGLVFPDQFISTAEQHGLIDALTREVLPNALRQLRQWHDAGLAINIAVNVSMDNLTVLEFPDYVAREVAKAGVPVTRLVLEITESRLMENPVEALDILTRLRLKHIGLSIDDFGTGHSSLAQLRDIPFDELKIDRGFVNRAWADRSLQAIADASLGMARQLGMRAVAEGVEDLADWHYIRAAGCQAAQGYFIAKPMRAPDLSVWMRSWTTLCKELLCPSGVA